MTIRYSFDSSAILGAWNRRLPPDVVPSFWEKLEALVQTGAVRCIDEVRVELEKKDDDALKWLKAQAGLVVPMSPPVISATAQILAAHPLLAKEGSGRNGADPFVIGFARVHGATVVTDESPTNNLQKPKIPDVCRALAVQCIGVYDFVRQQGWKF